MPHPLHACWQRFHNNNPFNLETASEKNMSKRSGKSISDASSALVPRTLSDILAEVSTVHDLSDKLSKLDFYIHSLQKEMEKIDVFKSQLPNCKHLLKDAIKILKEKRMQLKGRDKRPMMEELMPLKSEGGAKPFDDVNEKKNWMSTVQLWSTPVEYESSFGNPVWPPGSRHEEENKEDEEEEEEDEEEANGYGSNLSNTGGTFALFKPLTIKEEKIDLNEKDASGIDTPQPQQPQPHRKQRRSWSMELHNRFLDTLKLLGGPMRATPKQIRQVMNSDGLTNNEVKSHLQKYRLHLKKHPSSSADNVEVDEDHKTVNRAWMGRY